MSSTGLSVLKKTSDSNPYPTTLADLHHHLHHPSLHNLDNSSIYKSLKSISRSQATLHNRLCSILLDSHFVRSVCCKYPDLPLVPNARSGNWYVPPRTLDDGDVSPSVYFKSTDGHYDQWAFSLRRLNLHLLSTLGDYGGAVLVDATASGGKDMPDAMRWTVPIWVAVINEVLFGKMGKVSAWYGDANVESEESVRRAAERIEERMEGFRRGFRELGLDLDLLRKRVKRPMRIVWEVNGLGEWVGVEMAEENRTEHPSPAETNRDSKTNLLILCSASRSVRRGQTESGYIQGAADDSESWAHGLTPESFWKEHAILLSRSGEELLDTIEALSSDAENEKWKGNAVVLIAPTKMIYIGKQGSSYLNSEYGHDVNLVIQCNKSESCEAPHVLNFACRTGKLGSRDLRHKLPVLRDVVRARLKRNPHTRILITCATGKDLCVGVALTLLCSLFEDNGKLIPSLDGNSKPGHEHNVPTVDKTLVRRRLAWISSAKPDVNPSRSTLQSVNAVLMEPPP